MSTTSIRAALVGLAALLAALADFSPAAAQAPAPMKLTITVAGRSQTLRGTGQCGHEPRAWIHGKSAALWLADYAAAPATPGVSLSYWRLGAGGGDQFSLNISKNRTRHTISTIVGQPQAGSGQSSFRATALGGRFEIKGTAQDGAPVEVTIECARFGGIYAEGG